jgi:hypothetical protein
MHHHPILHASGFIATSDVIETGDHLLDALSKHGCSLVIHGHKHHPRIRFADTSTGRVVVFAAGSFSAILGKLFSVTRNTFHILDVVAADHNGARGTLWTWEWKLGTGWERASSDSCGFPFRSGFGASSSVLSLEEALVSRSARAPDQWVFSEPELLGEAPDLALLMPTEIEQLTKRLYSERRLELRQDDSGLFTLGRLV